MPITTLEEVHLAIRDVNEFKRLVRGDDDLYKAVKKFPDQAQQLMMVVVSNKDVSDTLLNDSMNRWDIVRAVFPDIERHEWSKLNKQEYMKALTEKLGNKLFIESAHTSGASSGAFTVSNPELLPEIGHHIGSFLDTKAGGRLARTSHAANNSANMSKADAEEAIEKKRNNPKK